MKGGTTKSNTEGTGANTLFVTSLERGFRVLGVFDDNHPSLGVTEIAAKAGMDKSAAQRFSNTLHQLGYLDKDPITRRYSPARRLMKLSYTYLRHSKLAAVAMPRLIEAGHVYNTTVNMAERDDTDIIYTIRIPNQKAPYKTTVPGRTGPLYCTSPGLAILSCLSDDEVIDIIKSSKLIQYTQKTMVDPKEILNAVQRTREQGFSVVSEQLIQREIAVSAPIINQQGQPIGAVQMPVFKPMWTVSEVRKKLVPLVVETADVISGALSSISSEI